MCFLLGIPEGEALFEVSLSLGGGFLIFISIFAGEFETSGTFFAGGAAILWGAAIAGLMGPVESSSRWC